MVASNLTMELRRRSAVSGARPPGQAQTLLLAACHGNETVHLGKGIGVPTQFRAP
jgi:hypothetical protein